MPQSIKKRQVNLNLRFHKILQSDLIVNYCSYFKYKWRHEEKWFMMGECVGYAEE
jgi:hypothetical protein